MTDTVIDPLTILLSRLSRGVLAPAERDLLRDRVDGLVARVAELETLSDRWGKLATVMSEGANTRAALLEEARDALESAGMTGARGDDWPRLAPAIEELAAENVKLREELAHCRHKPRVAELEADVARLTAGQCTHHVDTHDQHHTTPVTGCPWCTKAAKETTHA